MKDRKAEFDPNYRQISRKMWLRISSDFYPARVRYIVRGKALTATHHF